MKLQYINLSTSDIDEMSTKEICAMCLSISKHTLKYLGDEMMRHLPFEKTHLTKYRYLILRYINFISKIGSNDLTMNMDYQDEIRVYSLDCLTANQNIILAPVRLIPSTKSFADAGYMALIKLIGAVLIFSLLSLIKRHVFSSHTKLIGNCIRNVDKYTNILCNLFSQIPSEKVYFVDAQTNILSVVATVGRINISSEQEVSETELTPNVCPNNS